MIYGFIDYWNLRNSVTFDGVSKTIRVNDDVTNINIKSHVYSAWKQWLLLGDNAKYLPAIRTIGGDSVGGGQYAGDLYFLINGWKLLVDLKKVRISGVLYSDNFNTAYYDADTHLPIYPAQVSAIVNTVSTTGNSGGTGNAPTAYEVATQVRYELTPELNHLMTLLNLTTEQRNKLFNSAQALDMDTKLVQLNEAMKKASILVPYNSNLG